MSAYFYAICALVLLFFNTLFTKVQNPNKNYIVIQPCWKHNTGLYFFQVQSVQIHAVFPLS